MNDEKKNEKKRDSKSEDEIKHKEKWQKRVYLSPIDPSLFLFPFHDNVINMTDIIFIYALHIRILVN